MSVRKEIEAELFQIIDCALIILVTPARRQVRCLFKQRDDVLGREVAAC